MFGRNSSRYSSGVTLRAAALVAAVLFVSACADRATNAITAPEGQSEIAQYDRTAVPSASVVETPGVERFGGSPANVLPGPGQAELVLNGGFESNGGANSNVFTSWTVNSFNTGPVASWRAQTGTSSPAGGITTFPVPAPPQGTYAAMSMQNGSGLHVLSQVITLPAGGNAQLSFRLFIGNRAPIFVNHATTLLPNAGPNQQFRMDIMNPSAPLTDIGAGVLMKVYQTKPGDPLVSAGYMTITANLSAFDGQTIRLRFAEVDNQYFFNAGVDDVSIIANVNQPPSANAGSDQTVEATGTTTQVQLDGTSSDPDNNIATVQWFEGATLIATGDDPQVGLALGSHTLTLKVTDALGLVATDNVSINVQDTTAPSVSLAPTPGELWPPNHQYITVSLGLTYSDIVDGPGALTVSAAAVSSEADDANGNGDGNTTGDVKAGTALSSNAAPVVIFNPLTTQLELRAERGGGNAGRTYTIQVTVTDASGNVGMATVTIAVAHNP